MNTSTLVTHPTSRRWSAHAVVVAMAAALLLTSPITAHALINYDNVDQVDVDNFVDAAVAISTDTFADGSVDAVVLATSANFPDGLTASAVSVAVGGPVLFTPSDALAPPTLAEIDRLLDEGEDVFVMGGASAVSDDALTELGDYNVQRIAGPTRLETAAQAAEVVGVPDDSRVIIARAFGPEGANTPSDRTTGWVDAISCGAYAAAERIPILLTETDRLSDAASDVLEGSDATDAIICGGEAAVGSAVADALEGLGLTVTRVAGVTRVETAVEAARELFGRVDAGGGQYTVVNGYGENFGYGLAAAPLGNPILLVGSTEPTDCLDNAQPSRATLCHLGTGTEDDPATILAVGGETVISDAVGQAVGAAAGGEPAPDFPPLGPPEDVDAVDDIDDDGTRASVSWQAVADPNSILAGYNVYVDGELQGTAPTVNGEATEYTITGLTEGEEASVTVATVDVQQRESEASAAALVTPADEVPAAPDPFEAQPGNGEVVLTWGGIPADAEEYAISRGTPDLMDDCPGDDMAQIDVVEDGEATSYTDDDVTNGTAYCYQITVTDMSDQESEVADAGPVTPNVGSPQLSIQYPLNDASPAPGTQTDTIHYGPPVVVEFTATDTDSDPDDLRLNVELSYDADNAYVPIAQDVAIDFVEEDDDGAATFAIERCPVDDDESTDCIRDVNDTNVRIRLTVRDETGQGAPDSTGNVTLSRLPPPVANLAVLGVEGQVNLSWDRLDVPDSIVPTYRIRRASVQVQPDSEASNESCPTDNGFNYTAQPDAVQPPDSEDTVEYQDTEDVDTDGSTPFTDTLYCYLVSAERDLDPVDNGPEVLGSGNPLEAPGLAISWQTPGENGVLDRGTSEQLQYKIDVPNGASADEVQIFYCLDYDADREPLQDPCADGGGAEDGFTEIPDDELSAEPPASADENTVRWDVPLSLSQGDDVSGAMRVTVSGAGAEGGSAVVTGILFR